MFPATCCRNCCRSCFMRPVVDKHLLQQLFCLPELRQGRCCDNCLDIKVLQNNCCVSKQGLAKNMKTRFAKQLLEHMFSKQGFAKTIVAGLRGLSTHLSMFVCTFGGYFAWILTGFSWAPAEAFLNTFNFRPSTNLGWTTSCPVNSNKDSCGITESGCWLNEPVLGIPE